LPPIHIGTRSCWAAGRLLGDAGHGGAGPGQQGWCLGATVEHPAGAHDHAPALVGAAQLPVVRGGAADHEAVLVDDHQRVADGLGETGVHVEGDPDRPHEVRAAAGDPLPVVPGPDHRQDLGTTGHLDLVDVVDAVLDPQGRHGLGVTGVRERAVGGDEPGDLRLLLEAGQPLLEEGQPTGQVGRRAGHGASSSTSEASASSCST
jgi:hypothetical protein